MPHPRSSPAIRTALTLLILGLVTACGGPSGERERIDALRQRLDPARLTDLLVLVETAPFEDSVDEEIAELTALGQIGGVWISGGDAVSIQRLSWALRRGAMVAPLVGAELDEGVGGLVGSSAALPWLGAALQVAGDEEARELGAAVGEAAFAMGIDLGVVTRPDGAGPVQAMGSDPGELGARLRIMADEAADAGLPLALRVFPESGGEPVAHRTLLEVTELASIAALHGSAAALVAGASVLPALAGDSLPVHRSRQSLDAIRREENWHRPIIADLRSYPDDEVPQAAIEAIAAGADLVIVAAGARAAIDALRTAATRGQIPRWRLDAAVDRVLTLKIEAADARGDDDPAPGSDGVPPPVQEPGPLPLAAAVAERIVLLQAPVPRLDTVEVVVVAPVGRGGAFLAAAPSNARPLRVNPGADSAAIVAFLRQELSDAGAVVLLDFPQTGTDLGELLAAARDTTFRAPVLRVAFGGGGSPESSVLPPVMTVPGTGAAVQVAAAHRLFPPADALPAPPPQGRLLRSGPADSAGMNPAALGALDEILTEAIADGTFTAAAVAIGRGGVLVHLRGYGTLADSSGAPDASDRPIDPARAAFDLASLTKVVGTTSAAAILIDDGRLSLDDPVQRYVPEFRGGDKGDVTIRHLLTHTSGLPAGLWLFGSADSREEALAQVIRQPLRRPPGDRVEYSDLGMILLAEIVERAADEPIDHLLARRLFRPLGIERTMYLPPLTARPLSPPTAPPAERPFTLRGTVHDGNAFRLGGITGHAGLFSTARDLATFAQMMLDGGAYGGRRIIADSTIPHFTTRQPDAGTRALGWDTPADRSSAGRYLSARSFGHTGYTGTSIWIDPELDLFIVLLTNRTYTAASPRSILEVRMDVHEAAAQAITDRDVAPRRGARR